MFFRAVLVRRIGLLFALWAWAPSGVRAAGVDGVLLLRNGNLLEGTIARSGDRYQVESPKAVLQVPARQVAAFCRSKSEAYEVLRLRFDRPTANTHAVLAKWCLKHELLDEASRELLTLRSIDNEHAALPSLQRQLQVAIELREERIERRAAVVNAGPAAPASAEPNQTPLDQSHLAQATIDPSVTPAVFEEAVAPAAVPAMIALRDNAATADWEQPTPTVRFTDETRAMFVRSIQPMLVQSCSTAGCHQRGGPQQFQLDRLAVTAGGHPTVFSRNLEAVIGQLSAEAPGESPLLLMSQRRHGQGRRRSKPLNRRQIDLLVAWIDNTVQTNQPPTATVDEQVVPANAADIAVGIENDAASLPADQPAAAGDLTSNDNFREPTFEEMDSLDWGTAGVQVGDPVGFDPFTPRDPFDAEIFNRQFGPHSASPTSDAVTGPSSPPSK